MEREFITILPGQRMCRDRIVAVAVEGRVVTIAYEDVPYVDTRGHTFTSPEEAVEWGDQLIDELNRVEVAP